MSVFEFTIDAAHSKKNSPVILCPFMKSGRHLSRHILVPSNDADRDALHIQSRAEELIHPGDRPFFPGDDLSATIVVYPRSGRMAIRLESIGPRPKGFSGRRRDLHGHIDVPMDALQGIAFANDNQIAELYIRRDLED